MRDKGLAERRWTRPRHCARSYQFFIALWKAKEAEIRRVNYREATLAISAAFSASLALSQVASAGQMMSYIALPAGVGHATDAKGVHYPNAYCMKDVLHAINPPYPYRAELGTAEARDIQGSGMFRLNIDLNTGRVSQVTIIKSMGDRGLDNACLGAFKRWVFKPGKWQEVIVPTTVRKKWIGVRAESNG